MGAAADWIVYVVECRDGSLYTGVTTDLDRRITEHNDGRGARYTRGRGPVSVRAATGPLSRSEALRVEAAVKRLPKACKVPALAAAGGV